MATQPTQKRGGCWKWRSSQSYGSCCPRDVLVQGHVLCLCEERVGEEEMPSQTELLQLHNSHESQNGNSCDRTSGHKGLEGLERRDHLNKRCVRRGTRYKGLAPPETQKPLEFHCQSYDLQIRGKSRKKARGRP